MQESKPFKLIYQMLIMSRNYILKTAICEMEKGRNLPKTLEDFKKLIIYFLLQNIFPTSLPHGFCHLLWNGPPCKRASSQKMGRIR